VNVMSGAHPERRTWRDVVRPLVVPGLLVALIVYFAVLLVSIVWGFQTAITLGTDLFVSR
jgi:hypothetical protein